MPTFERPYRSIQKTPLRRADPVFQNAFGFVGQLGTERFFLPKVAPLGSVLPNKSGVQVTGVSCNGFKREF